MNNQYGYPAGGMQGYGQPQSGQPAPQAPYTPGTEQGYAPQTPYQGGYAPYGEMPSGQQSIPYGVPQQQAGNSGSYIPQTPYSPGYTSPGYQPQQAAQGYPQQGAQGYPQQGAYPPAGGYQMPGGYQTPMNSYAPQGGYPPQGQIPQGGYMPGYNPYGQMGKMPQQPAQPDRNANIPLNGGGYVPQNVHVRRRPFELTDWMLIAAGAVLIALFVAAVLILKNTPLKILLILLAAGSAAVLWVKPLTAENKRLTYSILALALCLLTVVSFLLNQPNDTTRSGSDTAGSSVSDGKDTSAQNGEVPEIPMDGGTTEVTPAPDTQSDEMIERLIQFFYYWHDNRQDEMLTLCAPSWVAKQENPRTSLFTLIGNRNPTEFTRENVTGTSADSSRQVTLSAKIDRHNDRAPELYRFTVLMLKENNEWYIDPQSLKSNEILATENPNVTPAVTPTATPYVDAYTPLYYNPNGGEYYHLDPYCVTANARNLPFAGQFTYGQINDPPYNNLKPCNVCGAPLREQ